jgi:hypothetical protein
MLNRNKKERQQDIANFIINEAIKSPVEEGTIEFQQLIKKIALELKDGKDVFTVINGELVQFKIINNEISLCRIS